MNDQVSVLKNLVSTQKSKEKSKLRVVSVTSGKGGVGKTSFTVNLSIALKELGYRVIILDGDLGLANVDIAFGITPRYTLEHLISGEKNLEEILVKGPKDIGIIPGGSGIQDLADLDRGKLETVIRDLGTLEKITDFLIIDTGAGLGHTVTNFLKASDDIVVITTPEPTSITDAYGLLKAFSIDHGDFNVNVIINKVSSEADALATFERLENAVKKFLKGSLNLLGWVYEDKAVGKAIMQQSPMALSYPQSPAYKCIQWIAGKISGIYLSPPRKAAGIRGFLSHLLRSL